MLSARRRLGMLLWVMTVGACALPHGLPDGATGDAARDGARPNDGAGGDVFRSDTNGEITVGEDASGPDGSDLGAVGEDAVADGDDVLVATDGGAGDATEEPVDWDESPTDVMVLDVSTPIADGGTDAGAPEATPDVPAALADAGPEAAMEAAVDVVVVDVTPDVTPDVVTPEAAVMDVAPPIDVVIPPVDVPVIDVVVPPVDVVIPPVDVRIDMPTVPIWHIVSTTASTTGWHGGRSSGAAARCNSEELLVGLAIRNSQYVNAIGLRCAMLLPNGTFGAVRTTELRGGGNGNVATVTCPAGQSIVRIEGRSGGVVDQLTPICGPVPGWYASGALGMNLGSYGRNGGSPWGDSCPARQMANGVDFSTSFFDDSTRVQSIRMSCVGVAP